MDLKDHARLSTAYAVLVLETVQLQERCNELERRSRDRGNTIRVLEDEAVLQKAEVNSLRVQRTVFAQTVSDLRETLIKVSDEKAAMVLALANLTEAAEFSQEAVVEEEAPEVPLDVSDETPPP